MELSNIRKEIDRLDEELVHLLCERLDYSRQSAAYKKEHDMNVFHEEREREVLEAVAATADALDKDRCGYGRANRLIYSTVVEVSRAMQYRLLGAGEALRRKLEQAEVEWKSYAKIVCQGVRGTFAHEAAKALYPSAEPRFVTRRKEAFDAVKSGEADFGLLPVKDHAPHEAIDVIVDNGFYVVATVNVQSDNIVIGNTTNFILFAKELLLPEDADQITVRFRMPRGAGVLYHTLGRFALEGLNITKLESVPLKDGSGESVFYLDFEGNAKSKPIIDLLCILSEELTQFTLLGNYREYTV